MHVAAHLDVDVVALETDDQVTVMLAFDAPKAAPVTGQQPRVEHTVIVVLDRSGSMAGGRLDNAKQALVALVDRLDEGDRFGLVIFNDQAQALVPADRLSALGRTRVKQLIAAVHPGGSTDLSSGYLRGLQEARRVAGPAGATVLLLSDGMANAGVTDPDQLGSLARRPPRIGSAPRRSASGSGTTRRSWPRSLWAVRGITPSPSTPRGPWSRWPAGSMGC